MKQELNKSKSDKSKEQNICGVLLLALFLLIFISFGNAFLVSIINEHRNNSGSAVPSINVENGIMKKFKSYGEIKEFLDRSSNEISNAGLFGEGLVRTDALNMTEGLGTITVSPESAPDGKGGADYSTTNVQVAGVDEGDIIKTDGKYIYTVSGQEVIITDAYPADDAAIISRIKLDSNPSGIYINGGKLAVYGQNYNIYKNENYDSSLLKKRRNSSYTFLKVFDISDRENPKEERDIDFEGNFVNSRMVGDYVYFITANYSYYYDDEIPVPLIMESGEVLNDNDIVCENCWNIYYFDIPYRSHNFTSVAAINISDSEEKIKNETYLLDGNQNNMFVSKDNIYITYNKYISEEELIWDIVKEIILPKLSEKDRGRITEIENAKSYVLSSREKIEKIALILGNFANSLTEEEQQNLEKEMKAKVKQKYEDISKELEKTVVHKIAINKGDLQYKTAGEVPGVVLNQFSMDEDKGYFRIATTKNRRWSSFGESSESYNNIYVLDGNMKVVGKVEKLARGERIYSVRFMQNRAYMVTFKQIDPLFVINLEDPTNPHVLGELKIPGFSNYLHPYDETTLIGLGKDSGNWNASLKLSLFDVSNIRSPKEIDNYILGDSRSDSIALYDHKAFLFSKEKNLLVIPVNSEEVKILINEAEDVVGEEENIIEEKMIMPNPNPIPTKYFNGATVFYVDKSGFKLKGKINHSDGSDSSRYGYNSDAVKRSLYIEDILYTLSNRYLKMNNLSDIEEVNSLQLREDDDADLIPRPIPISMPKPIF
jgi:uncharacterized secreted protein with C-terminal beta-propeller domain